MKKIKRIFAEVLGISFILLPVCACESVAGPQKPTVTNFEAYLSKTYFYEPANEYLRENDYPEEFLSRTGNRTKVALQNAGAVYQATGQVSAPSSANEKLWEGFSCSLTVSNVPGQNDDVAKKFLTFHWAWETERNAENDAISVRYAPSFPITWGMEESIYEIFGTGTLQKSYIPDGAGVTIPQTDSASFYSLSRGSCFINATLSADKLTLPCFFNSGAMFRMMYPDTISSEGTSSSEYTPYGEYLIDTSHYYGSFTLALIYNPEQYQNTDLQFSFCYEAANGDTSVPGIIVTCTV